MKLLEIQSSVRIEGESSQGLVEDLTLSLPSFALQGKLGFEVIPNPVETVEKSGEMEKKYRL
jgi:hypothetical protein